MRSAAADGRSPAADPRTYRPVAATIASPQAASKAAPQAGPAAGSTGPGGKRRGGSRTDGAEPGAGSKRADGGDRLARRAEAAFDRLYEHTAGDLLRQAEVLTGDLAVARRAVAYGFDMAWQHWPEVARDSDPAGWVRAAVHDYALSPWQRWLPGSHSHPLRPCTALETALLELPPAYRRALLLHDGLGLDLPEAAVENEATTGAMAARILHAREEIVMAAPELLEPDGADLPARLGALLDLGPGAEPPDRPAGVRDASERGVRNRTLGTYALTGLIALVTLVVVLTTGAGGGSGTRRSSHQGGSGHADRTGGSGHAGQAGGSGRAGSHAPGEAADAPYAQGAPDEAGDAGSGNTGSGNTGSGNAAGRPPFGEPARDLLP